MSSTDITEVASATAGIEIEGPQVGRSPNPRPEPREPDALEQELTDAMGPGIDSVTIEGPDGTTGIEAIKTAIQNADSERPDALFDDSAFVDVPTMDGQATDTIVVAFGGQIKFDATDEEAQAIFEKLTLGKSVTLQVEAQVASKQGSYKEKADGTEVVTGKVGLKVGTLYLLRPEDLV